MDYFENGNITNSVNYPACDMGVCPADLTRIALLHKNVPNMIAQISSILGDDNVNIANFINKARGDYAYTLIDMDQAPSDGAIAKLREIDGVRRVRLI